MSNYLHFTWGCIKIAFSGTWVRYELWSGIFGLVAGITLTVLRHKSIPRLEDVMTDLVWQLPVGFALIVGFYRMIMAPFWLYQEACRKRDATIAFAQSEIEEGKKRIAELEQQIAAKNDLQNRIDGLSEIWKKAKALVSGEYDGCSDEDFECLYEFWLEEATQFLQKNATIAEQNFFIAKEPLPYIAGFPEPDNRWIMENLASSKLELIHRLLDEWKSQMKR